jgi:hypothetical protein
MRRAVWDRKLLVYWRALFRDATALLLRYGLLKRELLKPTPCLYLFSPKRVQRAGLSQSAECTNKKETLLHIGHTHEEILK